MKKRILSFICAFLMMCSAFYGGVLVTDAEDAKVVDGSYLTQMEQSVGKAILKMRGKYLMDGDCSITSAGRGKVYIYGSSTANIDVDEIGVVVTVEQYNEKANDWDQVYFTEANDVNTYYVSLGETLEVPRGYYYRVTGLHDAGPKDGDKDVAYSFTDGIYVR